MIPNDNMMYAFEEAQSFNKQVRQMYFCKMWANTEKLEKEERQKVDIPALELTDE